MEVAGLKDPLHAWVIDYVIQLASVKPTVTIGDIRRSARRQIDNRQAYQVENEIKSIMSELESYGYVKLESDTGRIASWFINPELAELYKDHRQAVINAKQKVIDQFKQAAEQKGGSNRLHINAIGYETMT